MIKYKILAHSVCVCIPLTVDYNFERTCKSRAQSYPTLIFSVNTASLACLYFGTVFVSLVAFVGGGGREESGDSDYYLWLRCFQFHS